MTGELRPLREQRMAEPTRRRGKPRPALAMTWPSAAVSFNSLNTTSTIPGYLGRRPRQPHPADELHLVAFYLEHNFLTLDKTSTVSPKRSVASSASRTRGCPLDGVEDEDLNSNEQCYTAINHSISDSLYWKSHKDAVECSKYVDLP